MTRVMSLAPIGNNDGAGNQEKAIPNTQSPIPRLAKGVRNPITKAVPPRIKTAAMTHPAAACPIRLETNRVPKVRAMPPSDTRRRNSPIPGLPAGNVENSLCSGNLRHAYNKRNRGQLEQPHVDQRNPYLRSFCLPLLGYPLATKIRGG